MKKLILTLSLSIIALFGFSQTYDAGKEAANLSPTFTEITADTINAVNHYQYNGVELGLHDNVLWVSETSPVTSTGSFNAPYTTIQTALTAGGSNLLIRVLPGAYTGHISITNDSVTIYAVGGREVTFLSTVMASNTGIDAFDNTAIIGFTVTGDAAGSLIQINNDDNVKILNCFINATGSPTFGINGGTSGSDSLLVQNNTFKTNAGDGGIYLDKNHSNTIVDHNYFYGSDSTNGYAIQTSGLNVGQFTNNIIEGYASGIFPHTTTTTSSGTSRITISGNIIKECSMAIRLGHSAMTVNMDSILVFDNVCYLNSWGIFIDNAATNLVNTFEIVDNTLNSNSTNYENIHATLTPNSLSYWDGGNINIKGSIFNGSVEMIDLSDATVVAVKTDVSLEPTQKIFLGASSISETSADVITFVTGGANYTARGSFFGRGAGGAIKSTAPTATAPSLLVNTADLNTGFGTPGDDQLSLIAGGVEGIRVSEATKITVEVTDSLRVIGDGYLEADNIKVNDTIFADTVIIQGGAGLRRFKITLADDQSYALEDATTQIVRCLTVGQNAFIGSGDVQADGTVTMIGSGSVASTDSDGNLCLFKSGTTAILRNRLGLEVDIVVEILKP